MKILNNFVLVLPDAPPTETRDGLKAKGDVYEEGKHVSVTGTVLAVPDNLLYFGRELASFALKYKHFPPPIQYKASLYAKNSIQWETEQQLKVGDRVHFNYIVHYASLRDGMTISTPQGLAYLVSYDMIYVAQRDETPHFMLNGFLAIKPISVKSMVFYDEIGVRHRHKSNKVEGKGLVYLAGVPNKHYLYDSKKSDDPSINVGDIVHFRANKKLVFEYENYQTTEISGCYRLHRKDIFLIENNNNNGY